MRDAMYCFFMGAFVAFLVAPAFGDVPGAAPPAAPPAATEEPDFIMVSTSGMKRLVQSYNALVDETERQDKEISRLKATTGCS